MEADILVKGDDVSYYNINGLLVGKGKVVTILNKELVIQVSGGGTLTWDKELCGKILKKVFK